jgi:hypothetical protein
MEAARIYCFLTKLAMYAHILLATVWATIVHESMQPDGGVTLKQLDHYVTDPGSPWMAISLLFRRIFRHKGTRRTHRRRYE